MERLSKMGNSLKNFTYENKEIADEIYAAVNSTQFLGVSVRRARKLLSSSTKVVVSNVEVCVCFFFVSFSLRRATSRSARRATESL